MLKSKHFRIGHSDLNVLQNLDLQEGIIPHLENQLRLRNSLPDEQLEARLKKAGKIDLEMKK